MWDYLAEPVSLALRVVGKCQLQANFIAFEGVGQRREGIGGADASHRSAVECRRS